MSNTLKIDLKDITPRNGSKADAFEEFCCQIARRAPGTPEGSEFVRYRGSGGDGGVECIWRLPNGDEWGWQAKYVFDLPSAKKMLGESLRTALSIHPRLVRYVACLPFNLTGPTGRKGKSQSESFDVYIKEWETLARSRNVSLKVSFSTASTLLDDLLTFDLDGGRLRYWFDTSILGDGWFGGHLTDVIEGAGPRYTPGLSIETPMGEALEALCLTEEWFELLDGRLREFPAILKKWNEAVRTTRDTAWGDAFPKSIRKHGKRSAKLLEDIYAGYRHLAQNRDRAVDIDEMKAKTVQVLTIVRELRVVLATELDAKHGAGSAESQGFRQFQAEYQCSFPASNLDDADELIRFLEAFEQWESFAHARLVSATALVVLGGAGVGKTHGICDTAKRRAARNLRTVVLFGERFSVVVEPWDQIRQQVGFDSTVSRDAMFNMFDAAGEASGSPLLLCIDGLNETKPRPYWPSRLAAFTAQLRSYQWIRLCVSCRTTYLSQVIPPAFRIPKVTHEGFSGFEFDACREFFDYYHLEPLVSPVLQHEFSNPLFLRLICEAMVAAQLKRLPLGWQGINTAIDAFLRAKNERHAAEHDLQPSHRFPERALKALIAACEQDQTSSLSWSKASKIVEQLFPTTQGNGPLLDCLVREGMLMVDAEPNHETDAPEDRIRIAFERLGDHLLARNFLDALNQQDIQHAFDDGGALAFVVVDANCINQFRGLLEALSIQIPERLGLELPDLVTDEIKTSVMRLTIESLPWRNPEYITDRTAEMFRESFRLHDFSYTAFDNLLSMGTRQSKLDAFYLHNLLCSRRMPDRDSFWCGFLHKRYEDRGPVEKLIRAAFALDPTQVPQSVVERWAVMLVWFCAAPDRRVRDYATKALVRITEPVPAVWESLIELFTVVDDDYVVERCLLAAYGVLMRTRDRNAEKAIAKVVYKEVFKDSSRFQNASIRDHARCILELAKSDKTLPSETTESKYLPPYRSDWPLNIPNAEDIEKYYSSRQDMPKLYHSCMEDDFFVYTMSVLNPYIEAINRKSMARWIFQRVLDMGYTSERFANYDGYTLGKYGGGRGRPAWAERIGKKYQWIALAQLAARLSDHLKPKSSSWDPEPIGNPLVYLSGRDIDPSLLIRSTLWKEKKSSVWWMTERYDFDAVSDWELKDWAQTHEEMPNTASMVSESVDSCGSRWIILESHPEWTSKAQESHENSPYRLVWLQLRSYLIPTSHANDCWRWLQKQNFFGRWMPEGHRFHGGFIGEYPWATAFNVDGDDYYFRGEYEEKKPPCETYPTTNSLGVHHEEDAYQEWAINYLLPARRFFTAGRLRWDGTSGYSSADGKLVFLDPSVREPGPPTLLVEANFLRAFLAKNQLSIVWTVIGEKYGIPKSWPRLVYSRAHMLTDKGVRSSRPIITDE